MRASNSITNRSDITFLASAADPGGVLEEPADPRHVTLLLLCARTCDYGVVVVRVGQMKQPILPQPSGSKS
ncbi:unnamed protein product [Ectocarpus sp. CCAP 1310/34]|nr:unnamed protein product [Ectocarpus sp. CCAP 1310/34]